MDLEESSLVPQPIASSESDGEGDAQSTGSWLRDYPRSPLREDGDVHSEESPAGSEPGLGDTFLHCTQVQHTKTWRSLG